MNKIRVGIFFGGPSREREISFAGGRTVYDNLDKGIFNPVLLFVDSHKRIIQLEWPYIYKGSIRDFYPIAHQIPPSEKNYQIYVESLGQKIPNEGSCATNELGKILSWNELPKRIDIAFLCLHGIFGEDGQIQSLMESLDIPYTGSGVLACAVGMDKVLQKKWMKQGGFTCPPSLSLKKEEMPNFEKALKLCGLPMVIRPANQGSSIGVSILREADEAQFRLMVDKAFFRAHIHAGEWRGWSEDQKITWIRNITDIRYGIGFPLNIEDKVFLLPSELKCFLDDWCRSATAGHKVLQGWNSEREVLIESFIKGREFSCIVIRLPDGSACALPPTEIVKGDEVFDYRSKYLPGLSRKETPIQLPIEEIQLIRKECERLFEYLEFKTYARIDGFYTNKGEVILNDPNTTSGMMPSSFFFHQAAEIGLNPSRFITYLIYISLKERINESTVFRPKYHALFQSLDKKLIEMNTDIKRKKRVAVIMGGYSFERHISMESGRNIYEKLSSSEQYEPLPIFLTGSENQLLLYKLPIHLMLKDNADDIAKAIHEDKRHLLIDQIRAQCAEVTQKFGGDHVIFQAEKVSFEDLSKMADLAFIALHGRPGEDGHLQSKLESVGLPYNGSGITSSQITIDKYKTLQTLKKHGFKVTHQSLRTKEDYLSNPKGLMDAIESEHPYPLVCKPVDDGCSSAVKIIKSRNQLEHYLSAIFRESNELEAQLKKQLELAHNEEFPKKNAVLVENLITKEGAVHFMEITGGMYTYIDEQGRTNFRVFEPSEALTSGEILSLEEKFLAGEGQNITPARYHPDPNLAQRIAQEVKETLKKAAEILGIEGYCRIDAFVRIFEDLKVEVIIVEVNSLPGMTPATCIFHQAALDNLQPSQFIEKILEYSLEKQPFKEALNN